MSQAVESTIQPKPAGRDVRAWISTASEEETMTPAVLAELLQVSVQHVYDLIRDEKLEAADITLKSRQRKAPSSYRATYIVPDRTSTPAMLPNFEERNTSRISATPDCTSSYSGLSMPLSEDSMSSSAE